MPHDSLDRDFRTFRQTRDPAALAAVFDAAAPRLLLVAMHLCRDAATAEDLVQTVFLHAIRDADRFDAGRPVLPWLLGMLEHRASDLRRSAHVRRERAAAVDAPANDASPERAAAASEIRERVAEALAGMPGDYREVLTLRLVHGLSAVEIAHAQGVPPVTVRSRLRRGLDLLRGALPRGLATRGLLAILVAEVATARDGMAAVRAKVLAAAGAGAGATFGFGWLVAAAAALLLAAGSWWVLAPREEVAPRAVSGADAVVAANAAGSDERPREGPAATSSEAATQRTEVADPRSTTIRGRVVDDTGVPLAGVVATAHTYEAGGRESEPEWQEPGPVTTAVDGTFVVRFVPSRRRYVEVLFHAEGFVEEVCSFEPLKNGVDVDVGVVVMHAGTPVRLRLSCTGRPLGCVETYASRSLDGEVPSGMRGYGMSDADGVVDLGTCEPGVWWHDLRTAHTGAEARFDVPLQRVPLVVNVELGEPPRDRSIAGQLVDTNGLAVPGVDLAIEMSDKGRLTTRTRNDGRFLWSLGTPPPASVRERIELFGEPDLAWVDNGGEVAWGTHDLRLVVRRRATAILRLEVFDASTQQPVETFGATCKAQIGSGDAAARRVAMEHHDGGVATFELAPGEYFASVFAEPPFAESGENVIRLDEGHTTTLRVPLRPPAELVVTCVDDVSGVPLAGVDLALAKVVSAANAREVPSTWFQLFREHPTMTGTGGKAAIVVLARGKSDERGRLVMRAPADVPGLVLVAGGALCVACEQHDVVLHAGGAETTMRVTAAAEVRGVVTPLAFVERFGPSMEELAAVAEQERTQWIDPHELGDQYPNIELRPLVEAEDADIEAHVAADGSFAIGGVRAGRYQVWLVPTIGNSERDVGPVAVIDVDPAKPMPSLAIDVARFLPARGSVRLFVDGEPARGKGGLARLEERGLARIGFAIADGTAATPWLLPGTYVPFVEFGEALVFGEERIVVTPDAPIAATCALHRRTVRLTVREPAGEPARDVVVLVEAIDRPELGHLHWLHGRTDVDGNVTFDAMPRGRLRVRAFARDQDLRSGNAEPALLLGDVAADANAATFRLPR